MNVLMISNDKKIADPGSGASHRIKNIGDLTDGLKVLVLGLAGKTINLSSKTEVIPVGGCKLSGIFRASSIAKKLNQQAPLDVVTTQDPFLAGLAGFLIKKSLRLNLQLQIHTDIMSPYFRKESLANRLRYRLALFLIPRAGSIRVVSERLKNSLLSRFPRLKIDVLPIFVDAERIKNSQPGFDLHEKYPQFDFIILMASRFTREKNIGMAIRAMAGIVKKHPAAGLVIVGRGPRKENYKLQITNYKLEDNVIIEEWTDDLISYYKTCDLYLLISNYEGYGLTLVEAMLAGCPIVSTDVGVASEIIKNGQSGFVVKVGDESGLAEIISGLIGNQELLAKMRRENLNANPFPYLSARSYFENYVRLLERR